jgi:methyl halide transferase
MDNQAKNTESENYWSSRYLAGNIPWDAGRITTPMKEFIDTLTDKTLRILIPGAGNGYEAEYLHLLGFKNVYLLDISSQPLHRFHSRCPDFPEKRLLHQDFFTATGSYDILLEQTFLSAINPERRNEWVKKCLELLVPGGVLAGVLFDDPLHDDRPPYGGSLLQYKQLFIPDFIPLIMERCYNSIPSRRGREIFILFKKPI